MIDSLILRLAARALFVPLLVLSVFVLYRGHNLPGGGFIGGLLTSAPFVLISLASGVSAARQKLRISPVTLMAVGVVFALAGALPSVLMNQTFFTGLWLPTFSLPVLGTVHLGTPLVFDIGIYFAVIGFTLAVAFNLEEVD